MIDSNVRGTQETIISVVGAFDRHNYGDLLFPLIVERAVSQIGIQAKLEFFATTESCMSRYGSKDTKSVRDLFSRAASANELIIVAGGEVLPAKWSLIYSYLLSPLAAKIINRLALFIGDRWSSYMISKWLGSGSILPFVYAPDDFDRPVKVVYNAVGGSHLKDESPFVLRTLIHKLQSASYLSVRDRETQEVLKANGVKNVRLSPDCAVLLSRYYPLARLEPLVSARAKEALSAVSNGYICLQSAEAYTRGHEAEFLRAVDTIKSKTGLPVVVFAIGRATGHRDQKTFEIFRNIKSADALPATVICDVEAVFDLVWLIANARAYAGTSLHGAITSASYGVPVLALCPSRVKKLPAFLQSWIDPSYFALAEIHEMAQEFEGLWKRCGQGISTNIAHVQDVAAKNFEIMLQSLK